MFVNMVTLLLFQKDLDSETTLTSITYKSEDGNGIRNDLVLWFFRSIVF